MGNKNKNIKGWKKSNARSLRIINGPQARSTTERIPSAKREQGDARAPPTQPHHTTMLTRLGSFMGLSIAAFRLWPNKDSLFYLRCPWKKKMKFYLGLSASTAAPLTVVGRCLHHEAAAGALLPPPRSRRLLRRCHPIRHLSCNHSPPCLADLFLGLWMHALHFTGVTNWPMVEVDSGLNWICD
jgi:hypothetical protein